MSLYFMSIEIRGKAVKNRQFHVVNKLGVGPAPKKILASWFRLDLKTRDEIC